MGEVHDSPSTRAAMLWVAGWVANGAMHATRTHLPLAERRMFLFTASRNVVLALRRGWKIGNMSADVAMARGIRSTYRTVPALARLLRSDQNLDAAT